VNRKVAYGLAGVGVLAVAGFMIFQALSTSLVYFILPNEHAADPASSRAGASAWAASSRPARSPSTSATCS
jgi:cytochrome c-type biogenesis protein CcmE